MDFLTTRLMKVWYPSLYSIEMSSSYNCIKQSQYRSWFLQLIYMTNSNKVNLPWEQPRLMLFRMENRIRSTKAYYTSMHVFYQLGNKLFFEECKYPAESNVSCIIRANWIYLSKRFSEFIWTFGTIQFPNLVNYGDQTKRSLQSLIKPINIRKVMAVHSITWMLCFLYLR